MDKTSLLLHRPKRAGGFSLVEVALAIGIIAFAFVALFALVPTGLTTFRSAIDTANETWITQGINSMVQTTDFAKIGDLSFKSSGQIFYFDEEGKATDREIQTPAASDDVKLTRLYAVKLITQKLFRSDGTNQPPNGDPPDTSPNNPTPTATDARQMVHGWRVILVFANVTDPKAMAEFKPLQDQASLQGLPTETNVHTRSFYVARMDSQIPQS